MFEQPNIPEKKSRPYFEQPNSSKEFLAAKNFLEKYVDTGRFTTELSESNIDAITEEITKLGKRLFPGAETEGVIVELRNAKAIAPAEKRQKEEVVPEIWKSNAEAGLTVVGKIDLVEIESVTPEEYESVFTTKMIEDLHEQALRILGNEEVDEAYKKRFIADFITLYDYDEIEKNLNDVIKKEEWIKNNDTPELARLKKLATILEAILVEGIAKYNWLGKKIKIIAPSKYDELYHSVDAVVELGRDDDANEFLALGIDVSYRSERGDLFEDKINNLLKHIDEQELTQIKYLKDNKGKAIEGLYVPKIVVSVDGKTTENLINIWENKKTPDGKIAFENHKIAIDIIGQIAEQCKLFSAYTRSIGADHVADAYDESFELLLKISEEVPQAREALTQFKQSKYINKIQQIISTRNTRGNNLKAA